MKAKDLLQDNETAIVIFTDGTHLEINLKNGSGQTGNWVISPKGQFDKVIIYHRNQETKINDVYLAIFISIVRSPEEGRFIVHFKDVQFRGTTDSNWFQFAGKGTYPVRYL
ncbi:MAG: HNH endonuclease, partial [Anaerolineae bacterium]|nr:HNH endonuclease [Anaerolineae bacterium]